MTIERLIGRAILNAHATYGVKHFARPLGSFATKANERSKITDQQAMDLLTGIADSGIFEEVTKQVRADGAGFGAVRYFKGLLPASFRGFEAARQVKDLLTSELDQVKVCEAAHRDEDGNLRYELIGESVGMRQTQDFHVIVGDPNPFAAPEEATALVYTWHPGRVLPVVKVPAEAREWSAEELAQNLPDAAVKLGE